MMARWMIERMLVAKWIAFSSPRRGNVQFKIGVSETDFKNALGGSSIWRGEVLVVEELGSKMSRIPNGRLVGLFSNIQEHQR